MLKRLSYPICSISAIGTYNIEDVHFLKEYRQSDDRYLSALITESMWVSHQCKGSHGVPKHMLQICVMTNVLVASHIMK
jgi:hypothetical protein